MYELERLLEQVNKKTRFFTFESNGRVFLFDGFTLDIFFLPETFRILDGKIVHNNIQVEMQDCIFLQDIVTRNIDKKISEKNEYLLSNYNFTELINSNFLRNCKNNEMVENNNINKVIWSFIYRIVNKKKIIKKCSKKCPWNFLCNLEYCNQAEANFFFEKLLSNITDVYMEKGKNMAMLLYKEMNKKFCMDENGSASKI